MRTLYQYIHCLNMWVLDRTNFSKSEVGALWSVVVRVVYHEFIGIVLSIATMFSEFLSCAFIKGVSREDQCQFLRRGLRSGFLAGVVRVVRVVRVVVSAVVLLDPPIIIYEGVLDGLADSEFAVQ